MNKSNSGFSLVAIMVIMAVVSILAITLIDKPKSSKDYDAIRVTKERMEVIKRALVNYSGKNQAYPCPARRDVAASNAAFGTADTGACASVTASGDLRIGTIPVRTLGIDDKNATDGWGNYFTYVKDNTDANGITVTNLSGGAPTYNTDVSQQSMSPLSVVFYSHGPNELGVYTAAGSLKRACTGSATAIENCDNDTTFIYDKWDGTAAGYDDILDGLASASIITFRTTGTSFTATSSHSLRWTYNGTTQTTTTPSFVLPSAGTEKVITVTVNATPFSSITSLVVTSSTLTDVGGLEALTALQTLNLSTNSLTRVPDGVKYLKNITFLNLSLNQINKIPEDLPVSLTSLYMGNNGISSIPYNIYKLSNLETLGLSGNNIKSLPESFDLMPNMVTLNLNYNDFTSFPRQLACSGGNCSGIESLYLQNNEITSINLPSDLDQYNLVWIYLEQNGLTSANFGGASWPHLQRIAANNNSLGAHGDGYITIANINPAIFTYIDVRNNSFNNLYFPTYTPKSNTYAPIIDMTSNNISSIPTDIGASNEMIKLVLDNNPINATAMSDFITNNYNNTGTNFCSTGHDLSEITINQVTGTLSETAYTYLTGSCGGYGSVTPFNDLMDYCQINYSGLNDPCGGGYSYGYSDPGCAASGGTWDSGYGTCTCPGGTTWDGVSTCVPNGYGYSDPGCAASGGTWDSGTGICTCAGGYYWDGVSQCLAGYSDPGCAASGGTWDSGTGICTCPGGTTWDGVSTCAPNGYGPCYDEWGYEIPCP